MIDIRKLQKLSSNEPIKNKPLLKLKFNNCEICGSNKYKSLQSYGRIGANYRYGILPISICTKCGFVYLNPRLPNSFYKKYYKNNYRKRKFNNMLLNKDYEKSQIIRGEKVYDFFIKKIKTSKFKMLDHGCANGLTMLKWRKNGWQCIGIDPHLPSVEIGRKKFNLNIKNLDGESLNKINNKFTLVLSLGSLEHSYDLNRSLKNIYKVLNNNGYLIIRWRSDNMIGSPLEYYNHNHFRYFNRNTWTGALLKHQFKIDKFINIPVEGSDAYEYIIARKVKKKFNFKKILRNNFKKYTLKYNSDVKNYLNIAIKIKKHKKYISKNKEGFIKKNMIGLLSIKRSKAINRYFEESKKFLNFIGRL